MSAATVDDVFADAVPITLGGRDDFVVNHRYRLPDPDNEEKNITRTRVTTFCKAISDTYTLDQWGNRMVAKGMAMRPSIVAQVAVILNEKLDETEEKYALQPLADAAKNAAAAREGADLGTALHSFTEQHDRGRAPVVPEPWDRDMIAYRTALDKISAHVEDPLIERIVLVFKYAVAGKFDRILKLAKPCPTCKRRYRVADLKTGRDLQYGWHEIVVQLSLYAHADKMLNTSGTKPRWETFPPVCPCVGYVIHLPVGKGLATLYVIDLIAGWEGAELCHRVRQWRKRKALAEPISQIEVTGNPQAGYTVVDHIPTWAERIKLAASVGELSDIWQEASRKGQWTDELEALGKRRQSQLAS
jgi:hypothetical protein